ncbi:MAG: hypothetical protein APG10_01778 [Candidatus Methanofastidiosum methylothiophilum]|uniref:Uncharacterized protein n=1 Tax=Candidatus Methanofastidiosum methylothiophilum TaxID=1705564 RepID=A0A150IHF9_9EURY|nr:MAG: hypothetical protein APG10_01778 [Candidatus Methanofastidiosum methylthiophilus]
MKFRSDAIERYDEYEKQAWDIGFIVDYGGIVETNNGSKYITIKKLEDESYLYGSRKIKNLNRLVDIILDKLTKGRYFMLVSEGNNRELL